MAKVDNSKVLTNKVLFSYAHLLEPYAQNEGNGEPMYSACLIIPKSDTDTVNAINEAISNAINANLSRFGGKKPANLRTPLRDGDIDRQGNELYANCWFINTKSKFKPRIYDRSGRMQLESPDEVYSGMYGRAYLNFYVYVNSGNRGVGCGLGDIQKIEDGTRLSGGSADSFGDLDATGGDLPF